MPFDAGKILIEPQLCQSCLKFQKAVSGFPKRPLT